MFSVTRTSYFLHAGEEKEGGGGGDTKWDTAVCRIAQSSAVTVFS